MATQKFHPGPLICKQAIGDALPLVDAEISLPAEETNLRPMTLGNGLCVVVQNGYPGPPGSEPCRRSGLAQANRSLQGLGCSADMSK